MKYTINWLEEKTIASLNKKKYDLTLIDEKGTTHEKITMWEGFPGFEGLKAGDTVEGDIIVKVNGNFTNSTLYPLKQTNSTGANFGASGGGFKGGMSKMMDKKAESIEKSQDNKERGIILSATFRDATLFVTTFYKDKDLTDSQLQKKWLDWRSWLATNWGEDINDISVPF